MKVEAFIGTATLALLSVLAAGILAGLGYENNMVQLTAVFGIVLAILSVGIAILVKTE